LTSFFGFVIGDFLAQKIEGDSYDIFRCLRLGTYGLFLDGPIGHWWYTVLDKYVEPDDPRSTKAVLLKTAADQIIWAPVMTCVFFAVLKSLEGQPELIIPTIQDKLIKTIAANYVIWPAAHFINFRFVPTEQRILYNNCVSVAWTAYLSTLSAVPIVNVDDLSSKLLETQTQIFDSLPYGVQDGATQAANKAWEQLKNLPSFDSLLAPGQHYGLDLTIPKKIAIRPPRMVPALIQSLFSGGES
jgi:protein Mpv17